MRRTTEPDDILVQPGKHFIGGCNCRMRTVLGPDVVITLWNSTRRIGAMSHFLLAIRGAQPALELEGRYGNEALQLVQQGLQRAQVELADCVARIFGSGSMLSREDRVPSLNSGQLTGDHARHLLRTHGIPIVSERFHISGCHKITFDVNTGRAHVRRARPVVVAIGARLESVARNQAPAGRGKTVIFGR